MSNRKWDSLSDANFEILLENTIPELPPEDIVTEVTPWKKSINRVLIGVALTTLTIDFWYLAHILPVIGTILLLLGFRTLRHENGWFQSCFWVTIIRSAFLFLSLILNTTIVRVYVPSLVTALTAANLLLLLLKFICLWRGFLSVQKKAGLPPHAGGAVVLIVWVLLMGLLALFPYSGIILIGIMIVGYGFILYSLYKLSNELDEAGYAIQTAQIRITDRCIVISLALCLTIGIVSGYVFGGSYPMEWTKRNLAEQENVEEIKEHLLCLGFPEYVLNDLTEDDMAACEGALQIVTDSADRAMNDGRMVEREYPDGSSQLVTVYDTEELHLTCVSVQIPGEQEHWIVFHHFLWMMDPGFYGTEAIQLTPVYNNTSGGWQSAGNITGHVLYDNDGETFVADYYSLGTQTFTSNIILWSGQVNADVVATFSMPHGGSNHRGYITYSADRMEDVSSTSSYIHYTHQQSWMQYPAITAIESRTTHVMDHIEIFKSGSAGFYIVPSD